LALRRGNMTALLMELSIVAVAPGLFSFRGDGTGPAAAQIVRVNAAGVVTCAIGAQTFPAAYAGPQGRFAGLDQINVAVPASLAGAGEVAVTIPVDGAVSN
jgi:hypothetical protein